MASARLKVSVSEIPECERDSRRQICRVSTKAAELCNVSLGDCVRICVPHQSVICRVFPGICSGDFIQYDSCDIENSDRSLLEQTGMSSKDKLKVDVQRLKCRDGREIKVKLVLKDIRQYKDLSNYHIQAELSKKCVRCAQGLYVTPGRTVEFSRSRLAKLYGIVYITVLSCSADGAEVDNSSAVRVTQTTAVKVCAVQSLECYQTIAKTSSAVRKDCLGGLEEEQRTLAELLTLPSPLSGSRGVLLQGPPGCGKTSLVRQVALDCSAALLAINGPEVLSSNPGESESNLAALFDKALRLSEEAPCILFIDEVDAICPRRGNSTSTNSSRVTTALMTQLDRLSDSAAKGCGLLVVMATNRPAAVDPDLRRPGRLDREILVSVPTTNQRRRILDIHLRTLPLSDDLDLDWLSAVTPGYVGADLEMVCMEAWRKAFQRKISLGCSGASVECRVRQADFEAALLTVQPSLQRGVESVVDVRSVLWSDIGGLDDVKLQIQQAVEWPMLFPEAYQTLGLPLAKGVLLYGPPGCGKTTLAQAAATACRVTFLSLNCAQLYSPYVGDSEKKVSETFQKARALAPSVLFLDEIDSIVGKRSDSASSSSVSERVLSALLNEMDGVGVRLDEKTDSRTSQKMILEGEGSSYPEQSDRQDIKESRDRHVLVVAATNRPDMLDAALLRPGRMDRLIFVPPPDCKGRQQAFEVHTKQMPVAKDVDVADLAERTAGYTGADIRGVCQEAGLLALQESMSAEYVRQVHFEEALRVCKPSLPSDRRQLEAIYKQIHR